MESEEDSLFDAIYDAVALAVNAGSTTTMIWEIKNEKEKFIAVKIKISPDSSLEKIKAKGGMQ